MIVPSVDLLAAVGAKCSCLRDGAIGRFDDDPARLVALGQLTRRAQRFLAAVLPRQPRRLTVLLDRPSAVLGRRNAIDVTSQHCSSRKKTAGLGGGRRPGEFAGGKPAYRETLPCRAGGRSDHDASARRPAVRNTTQRRCSSLLNNKYGQPFRQS